MAEGYEDLSNPEHPWWKPFPIKLTARTLVGSDYLYVGTEQTPSPNTGDYADADGPRVTGTTVGVDALLFEINNRAVDVTLTPVVKAWFRGMVEGMVAYEFDGAGVNDGGTASFPCDPPATTIRGDQLLTGSFVSTLLAVSIPGPGTYLIHVQLGWWVEVVAGGGGESILYYLFDETNEIPVSVTEPIFGRVFTAPEVGVSATFFPRTFDDSLVYPLSIRVYVRHTGYSGGSNTTWLTAGLGEFAGSRIAILNLPSQICDPPAESGSGGGVPAPVITDCCPDGLDETLFVTLSGGSGCDCLHGVYPVLWDGSKWHYSAVSPCSSLRTLLINLVCSSGSWLLQARTSGPSGGATLFEWTLAATCTLPMDFGSDAGHAIVPGGTGCPDGSTLTATVDA